MSAKESQREGSTAGLERGCAGWILASLPPLNLPMLPPKQSNHNACKRQ